MTQQTGDRYAIVNSLTDPASLLDELRASRATGIDVYGEALSDSMFECIRLALKLNLNVSYKTQMINRAARQRMRKYRERFRHKAGSS